MAYFDREAFPFLSQINGLTGDSQRLRLARMAAQYAPRDTTPEPEKPARTVHFGNYGSGTRVYELPQPEYATVQGVRSVLGAVAASVVENVLCGDAKTLDGLASDEQSIVRQIAKRFDVELP